ncbi:MAG TPA: Asp-tRNA(Asn)/Glu-tRNA(Gln) amidotransferase subunit GatC, partial [Patescibacteria group bacterium]|nr:Asp-tRNA(Asn)/Glu-tRNA(Gln) amidotransferase subunit GatC [Patescibacteria group bacterium]
VEKSRRFCYNQGMLSKDEVLRIAALARIELKPAEVDRLQQQLSAVLDYVEELKKVDTAGLPEISQVTGLVNVQREDKPLAAANHREILAQAPEIKDGYFKVKAIL